MMTACDPLQPVANYADLKRLEHIFEEKLTAIQQAIVDSLPSTTKSGSDTVEFSFNSILYFFISRVYSRHDFGDWSLVALDGLAEPGKLDVSEDSLQYCGMMWTLGGKVGWQIPLKFNASLIEEGIAYELSVGTDVSYWTELTDKKKRAVVHLLSRDELDDPWGWAGSAKGEV